MRRFIRFCSLSFSFADMAADTHTHTHAGVKNGELLKFPPNNSARMYLGHHRGLRSVSFAAHPHEEGRVAFTNPSHPGWFELMALDKAFAAWATWLLR